MRAGKALEMFLKELCDGASEVAVQRQVRTLGSGHLCALLSFRTVHLT